jgi:tetratricopeptide (TPR) repeat protein
VVAALVDLASSLAETNEASQALLQVDEAVKLAREAQLDLELARAISIKAAISQRLGDPRTRDLVDQAVDLASRAGDVALLCECLVRQALARYEGGDEKAAEESYTRALKMAKSAKQPRLGALAHTARGAVLAQKGLFDESLREFGSALTINRKLGDVRAVGHSLVNLASIHGARGKVEKALEMHREAIVILKGLGFRGDMAFSLFSIGNIELDRRRYRQALDAFEEALAIRKEQGERNRIAELMNNMAVAHFEMGDYQKARELFEVSVALCLEMGYLVLGVESNMYLGAVAAATGDPEAGLDMVRRATEDARMHDLKAQAATGHYLTGFVLAGQGRSEEGIAEIRAAMEEARAMGLSPLVERFGRTLHDIQDGRSLLRTP